MPVVVRKLVNLDFSLNEDGFKTKTFEFEGYQFVLDESIPSNPLAKNKRYYQNGKVIFEGNQEDTIIFCSDPEIGKRGSKFSRQKRKLLDDLLIIGSLLTGSNWRRYADRACRNFPIFPITYLDNILNIRGDGNKIQECYRVAIQEVRKPAWQKQFYNGFHLRMLLNRANIISPEARFLGYIVIWEWLYPHLKNPNGATQKDESYDLDNIILTILEEYWNSRQVKSRYEIIKIIRNQLAHSGKFPIDRSSAKDWMCQLSDEDIYKYMWHFEQLTQVVVLKTLGINCENMLSSPGVFLNLDEADLRVK